MDGHGTEAFRDATSADAGLDEATTANAAHSEPQITAKGRRQNGLVRARINDPDNPKVTLRILCDIAFIGGLIGKGGETIQKISRESFARINIEDYVAGAKERVVTVTGERADNEDSTSAVDAMCAVFETLCYMSSSLTSRPSGSLANGGGSDVGSSAGDCEARLLVDSSHVGYLVGRGGASIKETAAKSGAQLRVLPRAELPPCASMSDEVLLVTGSREAVLAALRIVGRQLKLQPRRVPLSPRAAVGPVGVGMGLAPSPMVGTPPSPIMLAQAGHPELAYVQASPPAAMYGGMVPLYCGAPIEVTFKLLAPEGRAGVLIGRGGDYVRRIRAETGARLRVFEPHEGSPEERVVAVCSTDDATSPYCAAQDALIRCVLALTAEDPPSSLQRVRLLTSQASVGMVLGKRGATVTQLRQETGAAIKVLALEGLAYPESQPSDEIIQVEGSMQSCIAALRGVATLLRGWHIKQTLGLGGFQGAAAAMGAAAGTPPFIPMQLPPGMLAQQMQQMSMSPAGSGVLPLSPTSSGGMVPLMLAQQHGMAQAQQQQPQLNGSYIAMPPPTAVVFPRPQPVTMLSPARDAVGVGGGPGSPRQRSSVSPPSPHSAAQQSPLSWSPMAAAGSGGPQSPGPQHCFRYRMTNAQVGAVIGKGGQHINQIRMVSGARLQLSAQGPGRAGAKGEELGPHERMMEIMGSLEECRAAHSMVNQFLALSSCEPAYPLPDSGQASSQQSSPPSSSAS